MSVSCGSGASAPLSHEMLARLPGDSRPTPAISIMETLRGLLWLCSGHPKLSWSPLGLSKLVWKASGLEYGVKKEG